MVAMEATKRPATTPAEQHIAVDRHATGSRHDALAVAAVVSRFDVWQHVHATAAGVWVTVKQDDPDAIAALEAVQSRFDVERVDFRTNESMSDTIAVRLTGGWSA